MRIVCQCGRTINVPFADVLKLFGGLPQAMPRAIERLTCKRCFKRGEVVVSPVPTVRR